MRPVRSRSIMYPIVHSRLLLLNIVSAASKFLYALFSLTWKYLLCLSHCRLINLTTPPHNGRFISVRVTRVRSIVQSKEFLTQSKCRRVDSTKRTRNQFKSVKARTPITRVKNRQPDLQAAVVFFKSEFVHLLGSPSICRRSYCAPRVSSA